jgi:RNA polymerase sigma-70 factor (ECF subfamily)
MAVLQRDSAFKDSPSNGLHELIEVHGDRLLRSAYLMCDDRTEAQDLVQETLLQAFKSAHRFRGDSEVYTWLHGILRNLCHRHFRKQKRLVFGEKSFPQEVLQPDPANELDQNFYASRLVQALQELSQEHREVIVLRYYENLKIPEIAAQIGVSEGTVKSRLHHAVRRLKQLLPDEMNLFGSSGTDNKGTS